MADLAAVILQCEKPLHHCSDALKSSWLKQGYCEILESVPALVRSYLEIFTRHLAAAVPLLKTDNTSPVCRYIIEIWPVLMACTWKNCVLLAAFWDKMSIFHLGQTEHRSARGDGPLCTPQCGRIALLLASHRMALTTKRKTPSRIAREIEIFSILAWLVPMLAPKHKSRFRELRRTICWSWSSIEIYEIFGRKKIAVI